MTGALLQLVAIGNQDIFITGNPQISFFKCVYKRYSNFAMQSKSLNFDSTQYLNYENPTKLNINVPIYGELLSKMNFEFMLPEIYSDIKYEFKWIHSIGSAIITYAKLFINDVMVEHIEGDYINVYYNSTLTDEQLKVYNDMIGNIPELYDAYRNIENTYNIGARGSSLPSISGRKITVPLPFWFSKSDGQEIPIVALSNSKIRVEIELKSIKSLYTLIDSYSGIRGKQIALNDSYQDSTTSLNTGNTVSHARRKRPENPNEEIRNFMESTIENRWELKPRLDVEYIYLDAAEQKLMKNMDHRYLIERVQNNEFIGLIGKKVIELKVFNPTKELYIVPTRDDISERNQFTNYTNLDYIGQEQNIYDYQNYLYGLCRAKYSFDNTNPISVLGMFRTDSGMTEDVYIREGDIDNVLDKDYYLNKSEAFTNEDIQKFIDNWNYRREEDIPYINKDNYRYYKSDIINSLEIKFNGDIRLAERTNDYFSKIMPYIHHTNKQPNGAYIYSFSINPEKYQPSGACNFSNIKDVMLEINFKEPENYEVSKMKNIKYNLRIYTTSYNLLKIDNDTCQLFFSN